MSSDASLNVENLLFPGVCKPPDETSHREINLPYFLRRADGKVVKINKGARVELSTKIRKLLQANLTRPGFTLSKRPVTFITLTLSDRVYKFLARQVSGALTLFTTMIRQYLQRMRVYMKTVTARRMEYFWILEKGSEHGRWHCHILINFPFLKHQRSDQWWGVHQRIKPGLISRSAYRLKNEIPWDFFPFGMVNIRRLSARYKQMKDGRRRAFRAKSVEATYYAVCYYMSKYMSKQLKTKVDDPFPEDEVFRHYGRSNSYVTPPKIYKALPGQSFAERDAGYGVDYHPQYDEIFMDLTRESGFWRRSFEDNFVFWRWYWASHIEPLSFRQMVLDGWVDVKKPDIPKRRSSIKMAWDVK